MQSIPCRRVTIGYGPMQHLAACGWMASAGKCCNGISYVKWSTTLGKRRKKALFMRHVIQYCPGTQHGPNLRDVVERGIRVERILKMAKEAYGLGIKLKVEELRVRRLLLIGKVE